MIEYVITVFCIGLGLPCFLFALAFWIAKAIEEDEE